MHSPRTKALFSLGIATLALLILEVGLRLRRAGAAPALEVLGIAPSEPASPRLAAHPRRGYTLAPEQRASASHAGRYASGAFEFRGRAPFPAPSHLRRIVFLGESVVFGSGVDPSQTLPERSAHHLARLGYRQDQLQVLNYGVPGYTIVQVRELLEELLAQFTPDCVVLHVGAWNEQAPCVEVDDLELARRSRGVRRYLRRSALWCELELLSARWSTAGKRSRVTPSDFSTLLQESIAAARNAGARVLVLAPTSPPATAAEHPALRTYATLAEASAVEQGVEYLRATDALERQGVPAESRFLDFIHLTPPALDALACELAPILARLIGPAAGPLPPRSEVVLTPPASSCFGDERVTIQLDGSLDQAELPIFLVGGAPLLDVRREGTARWSGELSADAPGSHALIAQARGWCLVVPEAHTRLQPELALHGSTLSVRSRPGDRVLLYAARELGPARWTTHGEEHLDPTRCLPETREFLCSPAGTASLSLPDHSTLEANLYLQALVLPRGTEPSAHLGRTTNVLRLGQ